MLIGAMRLRLKFCRFCYHGYGAGCLSVGSVVITPEMCLLLPGDTIIPNNLTKPFQAISVPGPGADLPRDVQRSASLCRSAAMTPKMACELQGRVLADELFHPVERARRIRGMRLAGHEAVVGTLVELQFGVPAGLVVVGDKAAHQFHRDPLVSVAAKDQRRRQRALLASL